MKRLFSLNFVAGSLVLALAGCGGGGGGGGGGGDLSPADGAQSGAAFTHRQLAGDATARSAPGSVSSGAGTAGALASFGGAQAALRAGIAPTGGTLPYSIKVEDNGSVTLKNNSTTVTTFNAAKANFYTKNGVNFAVLSDTQAKAGGGTQTSYAWIGTLNYAAFGYWAQVSDVSCKKTNEGNGVFYYRDSRSAIDSNHANALYTGASLGTFTGLAAGMASNADTVLPLLGTASLTISTGGSGSLELSFPNFYKFTGSVSASTSNSVSESGKITGNFTGIQNQGNTSSLTLLTTINNYSTNQINGQLFGTPIAGGVELTTPSEAGGVWRLKSNSGIDVSGAFGVKK